MFPCYASCQVYLLSSSTAPTVWLYTKSVSKSDISAKHVEYMDWTKHSQKSHSNCELTHRFIKKSLWCSRTVASVTTLQWLCSFMPNAKMGKGLQDGWSWGKPNVAWLLKPAGLMSLKEPCSYSYPTFNLGIIWTSEFKFTSCVIMSKDIRNIDIQPIKPFHTRLQPCVFLL